MLSKEDSNTIKEVLRKYMTTQGCTITLSVIYDWYSAGSQDIILTGKFMSSF